jgi:lysyl-tRNA synthetase class II
MSSKEELVAAIEQKGNEIRDMKALKSPTLKEDLKPLIAELLALKVTYKEVTGESFDPPKEEVKKTVVAEDTGAANEEKGPSKTELNKLKKKAEKEKLRAEARAQQGENNATTIQSSTAETGEDANTHLYGDSPIIQSSHMTEKAYRQIQTLTEDQKGFKVWIRARVHASRTVGKGSFLILRQNVHSIQSVVFQGGDVSKAMIKYVSGISLESVVDVLAEISVPDTPILSTTVKNLELQICEIHVVSRAQELPYLVEDAGRNAESAALSGMPMVNPDTLLNYRWIDTRTPANQAIFRIQSGVGMLFREYLINQGFIEIHTPKLIGGASEGGSNVFTLKYFDQPACLAQSPQLYKQMTAACGGFERVFEIGPVFRAENSNTHR